MVSSVFPNSGIFFELPCNLSMEYFEAHSFTVSTTGLIASLVLLILDWFSIYFLYALNETLSLLRPLYLVSSFHPRVNSPPFFENCFPCLCSPTKNPKILFGPPFREKDTMKGILYEITTVNIPNLLRGWQTTADFIGQWF